MVRSSRHVTVMTYNVGNGLASPERLVSVLRRSSAEIVGMQELSEAQADAIARGVARDYPYQVLRGTGFSGRGLVSRYPIVEQEWLYLLPSRPDLRAVVDLGNSFLEFIVAHPPPPRLLGLGAEFDPATIAQISRLGEIVASAATAAVLMGDFNMSARHPMYGQFVAAGLVDAYRSAAAGWGPTFPLRLGKSSRINHRLSWVPLLPVARLDYVWHTRHLQTLDAWRGRGAGSDHLPVLARLAANDAVDDSRSAKVGEAG